MAGSNFFPYRTATDLPLEVEADPSIGMAPDGSLQAYESDDGVSVAFTTTIDMRLLATLVPAMEVDDPPVEVSLRLNSIESRHRSWIPMAKAGSDYEAQLLLSPSDFMGILRVSAVVARTTFAHEPEPGLAIDRGSLLAWSEPVKIVFSEPVAPPGRFLDAVWRDFSQTEDAWLGAHSDALFAIDPGTDVPILLLNSAFHPDIRTILESPGTTGRTARVRDASYSFIAQGAWSSLLSIALADVRRAAHDEEDLDPAEVLSNVPMEWKRNVFLDWAPFLFTEVTSPADDQDYVAALLSQDEEELVTKRLPTAIQSRFQGASKFRALIGELLT